MIVSSCDVCSICLNPLGLTFEEMDEKNEIKEFKTVSLHKTQTVTLDETKIGPDHKIHQICIHEWFFTQLNNEPVGMDPYDLANVPFSCPLCNRAISFIEAKDAVGTNLAEEIELIRICRDEGRFEQRDPLICTLF